MKTYNRIQKFGLIFSPVIFLFLQLIPLPTGMNSTALSTAAVALMMAVLWITEALPISTTALLPLIFFPLLGIMDIKEAAKPFAHNLVFLFLGGFLIAQAIQKWGLHRRIALGIIGLIGFNAKNIIAGFMLACAFLSMWISNTATALMMLPIGLSIISVVSETKSKEETKYFSLVLLLSIAYACSIGGVATLIGTPPNALMAAYVRDNYNIEINFLEWMYIGLPFLVIGLPLVYILLTKFIYPVKLNFEGSENIICHEKVKIGKITYQEKITSIIFGCVAILWIIQPFVSKHINGLNDTTIAIAGAVVMFLIPAKSDKSKTILDWYDTEKISWSILILFGGGLSLANGIQSSGLANWLGGLFVNLVNVPPIIIILLLTSLIIFLTELTSNLATTAAFIPIIGSVAVQMNVEPLTFIVPVTIAASCAFMLPVATPPNAIIFGSGEVKISEMAKAGLVLNICFIVVIILLTTILPF